MALTARNTRHRSMSAMGMLRQPFWFPVSAARICCITVLLGGNYAAMHSTWLDLASVDWFLSDVARRSSVRAQIPTSPLIQKRRL